MTTDTTQQTQQTQEAAQAAQLKQMDHVLKQAAQTDQPRFTGRYAKQQTDLAAVLEKQFGLPAAKVTKILWQAGCDAGAILKKTNSEFSVGRANKNYEGSLEEVASAKNTQLSPSLQIVHAVQWIKAAMKHGVCYGGTIWRLAPHLLEHVEALKVD